MQRTEAPYARSTGCVRLLAGPNTKISVLPKLIVDDQYPPEAPNWMTEPVNKSRLPANGNLRTHLLGSLGKRI
jgi:hypothetical protein